MALIKYPYTNLHELNLDWLIEQLNNPDGPVRSVNGKSGIVTLTGEDIERSTSNPETVATALQTQGSALQTVRNQIGVTPLPTTAQTLTGAIAENAQEIANVEDDVIGSTALPTTAQTLTGAIAENAGNISGNANGITSINNKIGNTALPTVAQTLTGGIAENTGSINSVKNQLSPDWGTKNDWLAVSEQDTGSGVTFSKSGNVMTITFATASKPHAENDNIGTIEAGYRPNKLTQVVGLVGSTPCVIRIGTDGSVVIWLMTGTPSGRLYFTATYITP